MAQNPLRNLNSKDIIEFLTACNFTQGKTHGDDTVFYSSNDLNIRKGVRVTINRKSTPIRTVYNIIKCSGISKLIWREWFQRKRALKGSEKRS